ncbi:MAG: lytic transglycosylase domain-containing protein [Treponema sp.]|nr:lytic transglycosylase domain-containing protein [Treponema sp.]
MYSRLKKLFPSLPPAFSALLKFTLFFFFAAVSCSSRTPLEKSYGNDSYYFTGLVKLNEGEKKSALKDLYKAAEKGSPLVSRRSYEKLIELETSKKKNTLCKKLVSVFPDEDALLLCCTEYSLQEKWSDIKKLTSDINLKESSNSLVLLRMKALLKTKASEFKKEFLYWCTERPFTKTHAEFVQEAEKDLPLDGRIKLRLEFYNKKYAETSVKAKLFLDEKRELTEQLISDTGKSLLYGSKDFLSNAERMENLASEEKGEKVFFAWFYAGRLYEKAGNSKALTSFEKAFKSGSDSKHKDQALWYYLSLSLKSNPASALKALSEVGSYISDREYFDDFFEELSLTLLSKNNAALFKEAALLAQRYASEEISAQFSYTAACILHSQNQNGNTLSPEENSFLQYALKSGTDIYYKFLAAKRLSFTKEEFMDLALSTGKKRTTEINREAEILLNGYADFGLPQFIYDEWKKAGQNVGTECAQKAAQVLYDYSSRNPDFIPQSLRIAARAVNLHEKEITPELLKLAYPRYYADDIKKCAEEFSLEEYHLYALIRSESFFDKDVYSVAGAKGLTQLMDSTAGDIARKLKYTDYDLTEPHTNIRFGSFYFEEMVRRLDGSLLHGFFAYNAGITRVRTWIKKIPVNKNQKDLFLEMLPYSETRGYGRKLTGASVMYALIYYEKTPSEVIEEIFK